MDFRYGIFIGTASVLLVAVIVGCVGHPAPESTVVISDVAEPVAKADYYSDFAAAKAGSPMELDRPPILGATTAPTVAPQTQEIPKTAEKAERKPSAADYGTPPALVSNKTAIVVLPAPAKAPVVAAVARKSAKTTKSAQKTVERVGDCRSGETLTMMKSGEYACCPKDGEICYRICQPGETPTMMTGGGLACCPSGGNVCYPIVK